MTDADIDLRDRLAMNTLMRMTELIVARERVAMTGIAGTVDVGVCWRHEPDELAERAYAIADAMLRARSGSTATAASAAAATVDTSTP